MDAKDLGIETALGEQNDGSKYSQSGVALQCIRNKSYQDIGTNPLAKAEVTVRPCAVIGPDRVVPPPASNEAYLKKAAVDLWPCPDNLYPRPPEYPHKPLHVNPSRNISPRQTFQENMQRIMVPPNYSAVKHDESNLNHIQDRNAALSKNTKQTMAPDAKYCDVPYSMNLLTNEHKNVREPEMCVPSVNSPLTRTPSHGWPPSGVNMHAARTYGAHEVYQYPQYPSCAGPRPTVMPMVRPKRTFQEDTSYVYPDSYYQDASLRFQPYPSVKERYPQARYDYTSNYPNPFHPPPYGSHKYDIPNTRHHPYPVYPHLKYLDNRLPDSNIEGYQRLNQQSVNYNLQFRNQVIHPPAYAPGLANTQNKIHLYPADASIKSSNKLPSDNNKVYVDYENAKTKYSLPDSYFMSEMARVHQVQKPVAMPNYSSPGGVHSVPLQYHRKDSIPIKTYEYLPHYRHYEHPIGFNPSIQHPPQYSPNTLAISPTDSNTSNDTTQTQGTQEDCGYVSQSSTTSARSVDSNINRLHNEYYRRYDYRYRPNIGMSPMLPKSDLTSTNSKESKKIDVRQFLSMWSEGDEENVNNNSKEISLQSNYRHHESAKSQDQLYVLGLVNVPNEELAKYEHIQKVSKLPENIKGYNSIELLNQFEEVIESSNINNYKCSTSKEFMPIKDRKNAIKQIVEVLPRPVSPLDVESKISQSVIHKEVGCNFEIRPCSPMLNVEIAAPAQNILGERAIEKVSNPLSKKPKSPSSMRIDGNTVCNKIQKQEITQTPYENVSCKMIGSPFTANNMESVKTDYSLHDLETNSGVCLASLPRLDNEIELNFPEVNQQFINANKGSRNLEEKYPEEARKVNNLTTSSDSNMANNDSENYTNVLLEDSTTELTKLSKYRKAKVNNLDYTEDESNANAIRTDSVIIENPENVRKHEEIKENIYLHKIIDEDENTPMNLTSQNHSHEESESDNITNSKPVTFAVEGALDFSLSKSENGLSLINAYNDELIKTTQEDMVMISDATDLNGSNPTLSSKIGSNELNTKSIIVRNNQSAIIHFKNDATRSDSREILEKLDSYTSTHVEQKNNSNKTTTEVSPDENNTKTVHNANSTKGIIKRKHKKKSKKSKVNSDIMPSKQEIESNKIIQKQKLNNTKSVAQSNSLSKYEKSEAAISDICKDEVSNTNSKINKFISGYHSTTKSERIIDLNDQSKNSPLNEEIGINYTTISDSSAEINVSETKCNSKSRMTDIKSEINDTTPLICDKGEVPQSNFRICQANKYYNDLISESELLVDKTSCPLNQTLSTSFVHKENTSDDVMKVNDHSTEGSVLSNADQQKDTKTINDTTDDQTFVECKSLEPSAAAIGPNVYEELLENAQSNIDKKEFNVNSIDDIVYVKDTCTFVEENLKENKDSMNDCVKTSSKLISISDGTEIAVGIATMSADNRDHDCFVIPNLDKKCSADSKYQSNQNYFADTDEGIITCKIDAENLTENKDSMSGCEKTSSMIHFITDGTEIVDEAIPVDSDHDCAVKPDVDKKCSVDSGYQSNKNSFAENDERIIKFSDNSCEDSVFIDQESDESNKITLNDCVVNNSNCKDKLHSVSDKFIITNTLSCSVDTPITENKISEGLSQNKTMENLSNTLQSNLLYDSVDANMEILFDQSNENILSKNPSVDNIESVSIENINSSLKNENEKNELFIGLEVSQSEKKSIDAGSKNQILLDDYKKINTNKKTNVSLNVFNVDKIEDYSFDSQAENKNKEIGNKLNDSSDFVKITDIAIDCAKSMNNDIIDNKVHASLYTKNYSGYFGKELYSPWIQKLIMHNEGKLNIQEVDSLNETKLENDYVVVNSLVNPNNSNVIKIATFDAESKVHECKLMKDMYVKSDVDCTINSENNENNINKAKDELSHISGIEMDSKHNFDLSVQVKTIETNVDENSLTKQENKSEFENDCIDEFDVQNNLIDAHEISFSYPNNSIISQITENTFRTNDIKKELKCQEDNDKDNVNCGDTKKKLPLNHSRFLKRSLSDSALNANINRDDHNIQDIGNLHYPWAPKRNKLSEFENYIPNNRRNSVNNEENVSFCILIDDNCIITEESEEKLCIAELQEEYITEIETGNELDNDSFSTTETNSNLVDSVVMECEEENTIQDTWIEDITCAENIFSDEVAENVVISALSSPTNSTSEYEHDESNIYVNTTSCSHTDKVKLLHRQNISEDDAQIVDTLYRTPHMDIMNKTLLYGDKNVESDNDQESIILESDDWKPSPTHTPDYIDPTNSSTDYRLETPENKENVLVKDLSPLRRIDDYLDVSSAENDEHYHVPECDKNSQDGTVYSCVSSLDNVLDYKLNHESIETTTTASSCSSEVSSTTSEEKNSSILLKITNLNGSRVSQINEMETINRPRCKFTEKKDYSTSNLNFPNRPLITKGAQKYIPPIKESIRDLKVKINLPQQSLLKFKQLKLSRNEPKLPKQQNIVPRIAKKPKPNFDDVLKSIDEIQIKRHKEKSKKSKTVVPKVVIKKNENGSHYASTPKRDTFSPDLTGRKWQPWVFLEKNHFIDKMAIKNTTKAIFSHRKKTYVLAEKFKKYKSVSSAKFVISQPKTPGQLKYTIRLKHAF